MNITDVSKLIAKETGLSSKKVSAVITKFANKSQELVYAGHEVKIQGLATFKIEIDEEINRYSFEQKKNVSIPRRWDLKVVRSNEFKKRINRKPLG